MNEKLMDLKLIMNFKRTSLKIGQNMDVSFSFSISMKTLLAWGKLVYGKKEIKGENNNNNRRNVNL